MKGAGKYNLIKHVYRHGDKREDVILKWLILATLFLTILAPIALYLRGVFR